MTISSRFLAVSSVLVSLTVTGHYLYKGRSDTDNSYLLVSDFAKHGIYSQSELEGIVNHYLSERQDEDDKWMEIMTIFATLFAVFFVYTGFKIESTREKVDEAERRMIEWERRGNDMVEYSVQLQYAMSYNMQREYSKAIDTLAVLRNEPFVLKDNNKVNTCNYFLANCYYEKGKAERNREDLAVAVEYINQAVTDLGHPFKNEIINAFNNFEESNNYVKKTSLGIT